MTKETENKNYIALFGGTFNPVHIAHLRAAEEVAELFNISKVFFIPSCIPPHKNSNFLASASERFEMIKLAVGTNSRFEISDIEIKRKGSSYSIDTIRYFSSLYDKNTELFFITGADAFREIDTWRCYPDFFSLCNFIVMSRPGWLGLKPEELIPDGISDMFRSIGKEDGVFVHGSGKKIFSVPITLMDVSSSDIRNRIKKGLSVKYLIPEPVESYILDNKLYAEKQAGG